MIFTKEQLNLIKDKVDYFEFYKQYLPELKRTGSNRAFSPCCFHSETKPSLCISLDCGIWRCFGGCNTYGDIFKFYQKFFNVSFTEAVQAIAKMYNVPLKISDEERKKYEYKQSLYDINEFICGKFELALAGNLEAWNYLTKIRGFSPKIIQQFRLGVGINNLPEKESLKKLGLIKFSETQGRWKSSLGSFRITFPRFDESGHIVSFTGRDYKGIENAPKYLHLVNTEIYEKSHILFGLYQAKKYIQKYNRVVIVEGECFKPDAEVLTPNGWVRFDQYNDEPVMQVNDDLTGEFVLPTAKIIKEYEGDILSYQGKGGKIVCTPKHNIICCKYNKKNELCKRPLETINSQVTIPSAIKYSGKGLKISDDMIRLLIAIQADGTIDYRQNGNKYIRIAFLKERKIKRFEELLVSNSIQYTKTVQKNRRTYFSFTCNDAFKIFPTQWLKMSQNQLQVIISELVYWDGNEVPNRNQIEYATTKIENAKFIQTVAHLCGYNSSITNRKKGNWQWYKISILFDKNTYSLNPKQIIREYYKGLVYCVSVPTGKILVRINDKITVIGNCDVIKCHQKGIVYSVASSGLNASDEQINILKKYTNNFYICVEDEAILRRSQDSHTGKYLSSLDKLYNKIKENIPYANIHVIDLRKPDGSKCDPDMYLSEHSHDDFEKLIQSAKVYNEYIINSKLTGVNPKSIEEKTRCINSLIPMLANIPNFLTRKQYIELVSNKLLIPENDIYRKVKNYVTQQDQIENENITWDSRPVFIQKMLLSMCFAPNFNNYSTTSSISFLAQDYFEPLYKNMLNKLIIPYVKQQENKEHINFKIFFDNLIYDESVSEIERETLLDIYLKTEQLEDFEQEDVDELINEQLNILRQYKYTTVNLSENELVGIDI